MIDSEKPDSRILSSYKGKVLLIYYHDPQKAIFGKICQILDVDDTMIKFTDVKTGNEEGLSIERIVRFEVVK